MIPQQTILTLFYLISITSQQAAVNMLLMLIFASIVLLSFNEIHIWHFFSFNYSVV